MARVQVPITTSIPQNHTVTLYVEGAVPVHGMVRSSSETHVVVELSKMPRGGLSEGQNVRLGLISERRYFEVFGTVFEHDPEVPLVNIQVKESRAIDRRAHYRHPVDLPVQIGLGPEESCQGNMKDLSVGGACLVFMDMTAQLKVGDQVTLNFNLPDGPIDLTCSVRRKEFIGRGSRQSLAGVDFISITEADRSRIDRYISHEMKKSG